MAADESEPLSSVDYYVLLGKARDSETLSALRSNLHKVDERKVKSTIFENYYEDGLSLCFEVSATSSTLELDSVFLYTDGAEKKYSGYKGALPHALRFDMINADVVKKFGEPDGKPPRDNVVNMFVDYKSLGLQVDFATKTYNDSKNPIVSVCVYKPDPKYEGKKVTPEDMKHLKCAQCGRYEGIQLRLKACSACRKVSYCSVDCQKKDWNSHKTFCLQSRGEKIQ